MEDGESCSLFALPVRVLDIYLSTLGENSAVTTDITRGLLNDDSLQISEGKRAKRRPFLGPQGAVLLHDGTRLSAYYPVGVLAGLRFFAEPLGYAIRTSDSDRRPWLEAILGEGASDETNAYSKIFTIWPSEYSEVEFAEGERDGAEFRFFFRGEEITGKPKMLEALARTIEAIDTPPQPLEKPKTATAPIALSLRICSPGEGFLCVQTPATADRLRARGLLPLPHNATAQLHVHFERPQHFSLFAFGPNCRVHAYVPHPNLPVGQARERLTIPGDLVPGMGELAFEGAGGAESFLLVVSHEAITEAKAKATHKTIARIVNRVGAIRLPDMAVAFVKDGPLSVTKALPLSSARPPSDPLDRLLAEIRCELTGNFSNYHFVSVHRRDPPKAGR